MSVVSHSGAARISRIALLLVLVKKTCDDIIKAVTRLFPHVEPLPGFIGNADVFVGLPAHTHIVGGYNYKQLGIIPCGNVVNRVYRGYESNVFMKGETW